jgi:long-chain acyl-CoA synthetase
MAQRTLPPLFEDSVKKFGKNILIWEKKGDRAALISEGRNDWVMSELGILFSGAVNVPISPRVAELLDLKFRLAHSECKMVIISQSQVNKIRQIKNDLPDL